MDWATIYRDTVRHMLPQARPYAEMLERFVLAHRMALAPWMREASAMLEGFGQADQEDLTMLARMTERGSMVLLPAHAMARLVTEAIATNQREHSVRAVSFDGLAAMTPLSLENAEEVARRIARGVVQDVIRATDWTTVTAANRQAEPGARVDMTSHAHRDRIQPLCDMALALVMDVLEVSGLAGDMVGRKAA